MATFWERAANLFNSMFSLYLFVVLFFPHFGFEDRILVLIASVPDHCLPFTF